MICNVAIELRVLLPRKGYRFTNNFDLFTKSQESMQVDQPGQLLFLAHFSLNH